MERMFVFLFVLVEIVLTTRLLHLYDSQNSFFPSLIDSSSDYALEIFVAKLFLTPAVAAVP